MCFVGVPSKEHEVLRRRVENTATEFWYYIRHQLLSLKNQAEGNTQLITHIDRMIENSHGYQRYTHNTALQNGAVVLNSI